MDLSKKQKNLIVGAGISAVAIGIGYAVIKYSEPSFRREGQVVAARARDRAARRKIARDKAVKKREERIKKRKQRDIKRQKRQKRRAAKGRAGGGGRARASPRKIREGR